MIQTKCVDCGHPLEDCVCGMWEPRPERKPRGIHDVRVFRFNVTLFNKERIVEIRTEKGPVPIFGDSKRLLGFASISADDRNVWANCAIDPNCPERLDLEVNSRKYWLDAELESRGVMSLNANQKDGLNKLFLPTVVSVKALFLTTDPIEGWEPVDLTVGGVLS